MDNLLSKKDKDGHSDLETQKNAPSSGTEGSLSPQISAYVSEAQQWNTPATVGAYGASANPPVPLSQQAWDQAFHDPKNKHPWMDDPKGRLAVRTFSRGVLGAAFFVAGGMLEKKWMKGYDATKSFAEQAQHNPLTFIAKGIDTVVGKPIEAIVHAVTGDAEVAKNAVLFRPTYRPGHTCLDGKRIWGRSLGAEVVGITADFFSASVGDAWGRDIAKMFDPNVKKDWVDDKGHIDIGKALQNSAKAVFRYVTYNGGEDWAVALPYVYFMKMQRHAIDEMSPGFKYDSDQAKLGNSFKVGGYPLKDGKADYNHQSYVTGSYALEGMLDLQSRFTVYNIGTLMYRELYNHIKDKLAGKSEPLYGAPDTPEDNKKNWLAKTADIAKWAVRSAIKGTIIMTPSVPFFWITRSTQIKHNGLFIHPDHGMLTRRDTNDPSGRYFRPVEAADDYQNPALRTQDVFYSRHNPSAVEAGAPVPFDRLGPMNSITANPGTWPGRDRVPEGFTGPQFHPYMEGRNLVDKAFDKIGSAQYQISHSLDPVAQWADNHSGAWGAGIKEGLGLQGQSFMSFTNPMLRASMSYTPYMYAKAEFANLWDDGRMDMAAERLVDGLFSWKVSEIKAGLGEVKNAIMHNPMPQPERELEARRRVLVRTFTPGILQEEEFQREKQMDDQEFQGKDQEIERLNRLKAEKKQHQNLSWQERVVQGKPEDKPEIGANNPKNYAEQEAMRKALETMQPPTNSVH